MDIVFGVLYESWELLQAMAPYLLFGFLFAGILHIFFDAETVAKHLGKNDFWAVLKASLFGIPLPLCSCGVLPAAMSLKKQGASKGAIMSFLISTPTTGIDSIFATYSLLGGFFTLFRVVASFFTALFCGILTNLFTEHKLDQTSREEKDNCKCCGGESRKEHVLWGKISGVFKYAFIDLFGDIGKWLIVGIFVGGVISYVVPESALERFAGSGFWAMVIMLIVGAPMYVCATGSIPIAAALMMKGLSPGAAFVFLLAGPATSTVSMAVIGKNMGKRELFIYLFSIAFCGLSFGYMLDLLWSRFGAKRMADMVHSHEIMPEWIGVLSSVVLVALFLYNLYIRMAKQNERCGA